MNGFVLIEMASKQVLLSSAKDIAVRTIIIVILSIVLAGLVGYYISRGITKTISKINDFSKKASAGDLTAELSTKRSDELGLLTDNISVMLSSMKGLIGQTSDISKTLEDSITTVADTSNKVSNISQEISRAMQEIVQGSACQAENAEEGAKKMNSLATKINDVTENTVSIQNIANDTVSLTKKGLSSIENLDQIVNNTTASTRAVITDIEALDKQSKSISDIIKVISSIADQTNLLSLNAAIEAARAGESGKGFAVVADEVRNLAEQSLQSSKSIGKIIKNIQLQTSKTVEKTTSAAELLESQNEAIKDSIKTFQDIWASMNNLITNLKQIVIGIGEVEQAKDETLNSMESISSVSQQSASASQEVCASIQEQLASIEELDTQAQKLTVAAGQLSESINRFKL